MTTEMKCKSLSLGIKPTEIFEHFTSRTHIYCATDKVVAYWFGTSVTCKWYAKPSQGGTLSP